ncbi:hypothetical protein M5K25_018062 [Dendrobium thyrsiflorum]|uniref:Uncharacterized protein n=1 Tax=Dendrobium thyrsiflorum TaxID=117978 RepID=A0ABD0UNW7_DENTH
MGDPDVDHGFLYDDQGRMDILGSPFFDVHFGNDETANEYIDRILYQLTLSIEEHIPPGRWYLVSRPLTSSDLTTAPTTTTRGFYLLLVALLALRHSFFRESGIAKLNIQCSDADCDVVAALANKEHGVAMPKMTLNVQNLCFGRVDFNAVLYFIQRHGAM